MKRSENWSRPIPSMGLGRNTTTAALDMSKALLLSTHSLDPCYWEESDIPA